MTLAELNACGKEQFVAAIGWVFEHSPWVAERGWRKRPFASFDELSTKLIQEVQSASPDQQLALLCAHSELSPDGLTPAEAEELSKLNAQYKKRFGFPFIFAVKGSDKATIMEALRRRIKSPPEQEFQVALGHVFRIARFRLEDTIR